MITTVWNHPIETKQNKMDKPLLCIRTSTYIISALIHIAVANHCLNTPPEFILPSDLDRSQYHFDIGDDTVYINSARSNFNLNLDSVCSFHGIEFATSQSICEKACGGHLSCLAYHFDFNGRCFLHYNCWVMIDLPVLVWFDSTHWSNWCIVETYAI